MSADSAVNPDETYSDPLDSPTFDPIAFLNSKFPTEDSLVGLDTFAVGIGSQISVLDEEISKAVQFQSTTGQLSSREIANAQAAIAELFEKINDIKSKSSQSEHMVQDICSDIKRLDYAKKHLQLSITSLKRLQMLNNAVDQLEIYSRETTKSKIYREAAALLDAIGQLMTHFETFTEIPTIIEVRQRVENIKEGLKEHIYVMFRGIGELIDVGDGQFVAKSNAGGGVIVSDICLLIDALGYEFRQKLLESFISTQLQPYQSIFGPENKQHSSLDQVERRWAWLKRLIKAVEARFGNIFPAYWQGPLRIAVKFYEDTREHMSVVLAAMEASRTDNSDVHNLLKALQSVLRFEAEMSAKFNIANSGSSNGSFNSSMNSSGSSKDDPFDAIANSIIPNGISSIFDRYLGSYVILERHNLEELIERLRKEEDTTNGSTSHGNVYGSSMSMFAFIKSSIKRCTLLTTGFTFLSLCKEFKLCMTNYAELLRATKSTAASRPSSTSFSYEVNLCYMVNTSEYCVEVVPQLEVMVKQKINPQLVEKVDFSSELDTFADLGSYALKCLVTSSIERMENAFRDMRAINWGGITQVGEESDYCHMWHPPLAEVMPRIRESLSPLYFNNFCMKLATDMLTKFQDIITKQNKITEMGAQQLLLDTHSFKNVLLHLHQIGQDSNSPNPLPAAPSMYVKFINTRIGLLETILKLVSTPEAHLLERFRVLWPDGQSSDLQMLMSIKGSQKKYQQTTMESLSLGLGLGMGSGNISATMSNMTASATAAFLSLTKK